MFRLRVYESGDGDCIALREGRRTVMIFDTGRKTPYREGRGFRMALDQAKRGREASEEPPSVVISHVDADHVDGLVAWVESILKGSKTWDQARSLAQSEVADVWCNVPPEDQAFAECAGIPLWEPLADVERMESVPDPSSVSIDESVEYLPREIAGSGENGVTIDELVESQQKVAALLTGCSPQQQIGNSEGNGRGALGWRNQAFRLLVRSAQEAFGCNAGQLIGRGLDAVGSDPDLTQRAHAGAWLRRGGDPMFSISVNHVALLFSLNSPIGVGVWHPPSIERFMDPTVLDLLNRAESAYELMALALQLADQRAEGDARQDIRRFRAVLGLQPFDEMRSRLGLFACLNLLGVPVRGCASSIHSTLENLLHLDEEVECEVLAPTQAEIETVLSEWDRFRERLTVRRPTHLSMAMMMTADLSQAVKWSADTSLTNQSSIALWFPKLGHRSTVVLTGDSLHEKIMDSLAARIGDRPGERVLRYQIPHHGSRHNTNPNGKCLQDCLPETWRIQTAFASGGLAGDDRRPHRNVVSFFGSRRGARHVREVRRELADKGKDYVDFQLV